MMVEIIIELTKGTSLGKASGGTKSAESSFEWVKGIPRI